MKSNQILAIIPARGGSKGIEKKNIVDICGKPLIQYTIEPAMKMAREQRVEQVIVSTDCEEIAAVSKALGADVPFLRPKHLATDTSKSIDFILHALDFYESKNMVFDAVMLLQPTSPLRNYEDMAEVHDLWNRTRGASDSLVSVYREDRICDLVMYQKEGFFGLPLNSDHNKGTRRQNHQEIYIRNGAFFVTQVSYLKDKKQIISDQPVLHEMPKHRSLDLDTKEDLEFLRRFMASL